MSAALPLKRLNRLRKLAQGQDIQGYLLTDVHQNWKAIEDTFQASDQKLSDTNQSIADTNTALSDLVAYAAGLSKGTNSGSYTNVTTTYTTASTVNVVIPSDTSSVVLAVMPYTSGGVISLNGSSQELQFRYNGTPIYVNTYGTTTLPSIFMVYVPGVAGSATFQFGGRAIAGAGIAITNMSLMALVSG